MPARRGNKLILLKAAVLGGQGRNTQLLLCKELLCRRGAVLDMSAQFRVLHSGGCAWPSHSLRDPAAVGVGWTPLATTGLPAPRRGSSRARTSGRAFAVRAAHGGARVARNVRVADMNIDVPVADDRRIEVIANGLPLWHSAQLGLDATLVSPLTRAGEPHPPADVEPGHCVAAAARRNRQGTYPELQRARRCRLVVIGFEVGGALALKQLPSSACLRATGLRLSRRTCDPRLDLPLDCAARSRGAALLRQLPP